MSTISIENYLKALHHLEAELGQVSSGALATAVDVTQPSATKALKTLAAVGLVENEPYKGARLTVKGNRAALNVIRKHRLIEVFLTEVLGYEWDEVHDEAERLEHAVSDRLADRIDEFLGHPTADPHGDPIPQADGSMPDQSSICLDELSVGEKGKVVRVLTQDRELLRYLDSLGIRPGKDVLVLDLGPFDGPVKVSTETAEAGLGRALARRIRVERSQQHDG